MRTLGKAKAQRKIDPRNRIFLEVLGKNIMVVIRAGQLNILGQTFRPIFVGKCVRVTDGFITLNPVIVKMPSAPFHRFPTPLSFLIETVENFTPFDPDTRFPLT